MVVYRQVLSALNFFLAPDNELTDNVTEAAYRCVPIGPYSLNRKTCSPAPGHPLAPGGKWMSCGWDGMDV
jgi:hypothetical protein